METMEDETALKALTSKLEQRDLTPMSLHSHNIEDADIDNHDTEELHAEARCLLM